MSAKRYSKIFCCLRMIGDGFYKSPYRADSSRQRSVAGLTVLAMAATILPAPAMAAKQPVVRSAAPKLPATVISQLPETAYTLGAGDRIRLDIFAVPEYTGEYQVLVDGTLNLPVIGSIPVGGLTIRQVTDIVTARYARYVKRPIVTISLLIPRPIKVGVSGEVIRPGSYTLTVAEGRQYPSLTQAIQQAGGTTQSANVRQVVLRRRGQVFNLNLSELLRTGSLTQDITLRDGDTIFIPTAAAINPNEGRQLTSSSFGAQILAPLNIAIVGEVNRPGTYAVAADNIAGASSVAGTSNTPNISKPPSLTKVIQLAGGVTSTANIRAIRVRRLTNGGAQDIGINLTQLVRSGDVSQDIPLQDGDTIFIPTVAAVNPQEARQIILSSIGSQSLAPLNIAVVGEVTRPGTYTVAPDNVGAGGGTGGSSRPPTVTKLLQLAGGYTPSANISSITVRRLTRTGGAQDINVNLRQLLQAGDVNQDILLQDGDTIIIPTVTAINPSDNLLLSSASFAAASQQNQQPLKIAVVGEVFRPGSYVVSANQTAAGTTAAGATATGTLVGSGSPPTVTKALQGAGGITPLADVRTVEVRRFPRNGQPQVIPVNLWQLLVAGDLTQDIILQDGDTIVVPKAVAVNPAEASIIAAASISPTSITVNVVGEVQKSGPVQVPPNSTLNQALLAAGGFNNARARSSKVDLVRLNPNGSVTKRTVVLDFSQGINDKNNPTVQNNDIIVVQRSTVTQVSDTLGTLLSPITGLFSTLGLFRIFGGN